MNARSHRELVQRALLSSPLFSSTFLLSSLLSTPLQALASRGFVTRVSPSRRLPLSLSLSLRRSSTCSVRDMSYTLRIDLASEILYLDDMEKREVKPEVNWDNENPRSSYGDRKSVV